MRSIGHLRVCQADDAAVERLKLACARVSATVEPVVAPPGAEVFVDFSAPGSRGLWRILWREVCELVPGACLGLATSKLVARVASSMALNQPSHLCAVRPGQEAALLAPLPVEALWLADSATHERLRRLGLVRCGQVANASRSALQQQFGDLGYLVHNWSHGLDLSPVHPLYPDPTCHSRLTFSDSPLSDTNSLSSAVSLAADTLAQKLDSIGRGCRQLTLSLSGESGTEYSSLHCSASALLANAPALRRAALRLLQRASVAEPIRAVALVAGSLEPILREQGSLFARSFTAPWELADTMEVICDRFGAAALQKGSALLPPRRERFLAALEQQWLG